MSDQLTRIESKLDKVDAKLDNHLERIAKVEVKADGSIKIGLAIFTGIIMDLIRRTITGG
jgi:hypothetical protein